MNQDSKWGLIILNTKITIIDYGVGNLKSILAAFTRLNYTNTRISSNHEEILNSEALVLPGVGAFGFCAQNLSDRGLRPILATAVLEDKKPILGICVGMQLFGTNSEESPGAKGLNWIPGVVRKISTTTKIPLPHVGWNSLVNLRHDGILKNSLNGDNFYFDHSFYLDCDESLISSNVNYGNALTASITKENIHGVQFHPEKSQENGLRIFNLFGKSSRNA